MNIGDIVKYDDRLTLMHPFEDIYLFYDNLDGVFIGTAYVVIGREKALVIDTCNGAQDFKAAVRTLTDLPLILVNTHAHGGHVGGNRFFEKTLMGEAELPAYTARPDAIPAEIIREGDIIDLGGKTIEAISFPGHTPGAVCLLDHEDRVMFTGDSVLGRIVVMCTNNSVNISTFRNSLEHLNTYRSKFDHILTGHSYMVDDPVYIDALIDACNAILNGGPAERFTTMENRGVMCPVCYYTGEDGKPATLVYREDLAR